MSFKRSRALGALSSVGALCALLSVGCGLDAPTADDPAAGPDGSVPGYSNELLFMTVGDPAQNGSPPPGGFQDALDGWTYVFDASGQEPEYMCQHATDEVIQKAEENLIPFETPCVAPVDEPPTTASSTTTGMNGMPAGYKSWVGAQTGGCGTWAVAMCDRILGETDPSTQVDQAEWDRIATGIGQTSGGSSLTSGRQAYYAEKGYCATYQRFDGGADGLAEIQSKFEDGCDVKLSFARRVPGADPPYADGHVETVTGFDGESIVTNSWGKRATIAGGSAGDFHHSEDGASFRRTGGDVWPADGTDVWVEYVCECSMWESLGKAILGG